MLNNKVLMSDALNFSIEHPINPYYLSPSVDKAVAQQEHQSIKNALESAEIEVVQVPSPKGSQDGVYTANWALIRGNKAVLSRLPEVRKAEEAYAEEVLLDLGYEVFKIPEGLKFSGQGDALPCGDYLFCGQDYRSDSEAQKFVADKLGLKLVQLKAVPQLDSLGEAVVNKTTGWNDSYFYDIDLALAVIKEPSEAGPGRKAEAGLIAYCPEAFTEESRELLESIDFVDKIHVSLDEARQAFATNLVSTGEAVVMSSQAPNLANELRSIGIRVITPQIEELSKGGGYIRCTTLTLS